MGGGAGIRESQFSKSTLRAVGLLNISRWLGGWVVGVFLWRKAYIVCAPWVSNKNPRWKSKEPGAGSREELSKPTQPHHAMPAVVI